MHQRLLRGGVLQLLQAPCPERPPGCGEHDALDRRLTKLAVAALGTLAVEPLYVLVDTAIVGRLGTPQLGGLALAATVMALVVGACTFLTYGTTERVEGPMSFAAWSAA